MGLFSRYDREPAKSNPEPAKSGFQPTAKTPAGTPASTTTSKNPAKKTIPTPTRRQAEQARRDRIQPVLTRKESRRKENESRYRARDEAMAKVHAKPHNALIRDWIDRRWNVAEFILPAMILFFVATIAIMYIWPSVMTWASYIIWAVFALLILDTIWMWIGLRRQLKIHFPNEPIKGKFSYALTRMMLLRRSRMPPPRVKRGTRFVWPNPDDHR